MSLIADLFHLGAAVKTVRDTGASERNEAVINDNSDKSNCSVHNTYCYNKPGDRLLRPEQ